MKVNERKKSAIVTKVCRSARHRLHTTTTVDHRSPTEQSTAAVSNFSPPSSIPASENTAEIWGGRLQQAPTYLTKDGLSWYIVVKRWFPTPSKAAFQREWALHPSKRHKLKVYGRETDECRWSQSWGVDYAYSGAVNQSRPISESTILPGLLKRINVLLKDDATASSGEENSNEQNPYNGCLQNWYTPQDKIGLHSDDERSLLQEYPIWSLSWGGTRRFLFRPKPTKKDPSTRHGEQTIEILLEDGDLLLMGGTCQITHKHEVPKLRVTKDPPTSNRINWTIRAFR